MLYDFESFCFLLNLYDKILSKTVVAGHSTVMCMFEKRSLCQQLESSSFSQEKRIGSF